ncbi:glycosyl transferase family 9 [Paludibacter propionicigenes WB4]|uniref:Glycosyl transferase family 9 n=1 Tax=Paludibacter propionicigenes (strain DSM 17365 / JCM 13257 / WB4) TaxID=694427 RepID=E4T5T7_PALPW|nr:glycosyltransferase family 9 protein [Paludibacter propionicigenes]ADQ80081.1 glycosyl transferase family 9 [Paludibacter propionicigenes WB4]
MSRILIIRFSALGDVAMTVPVIYSLAKAFPMHEITVLSRESFKPLFDKLPSNVRFIGADLSTKHRGLGGLNVLYKELKTEKYDYIADLHSVLRSRYLCLRFKLAGAATASIRKGRNEKKQLTRKNNKIFASLKSGFARYYDVFERLGFRFDLRFNSIFENEQVNLSEITTHTGEKTDEKWLGIAPFAKHKGKIYPLELQEKVIEHFANNQRVKVFLFGGGEYEKKIIDDWKKKYSAIVSMAGKLNMSQELVLMSQLDVMYSMDSANMHLASLVDTKVVSLWGATHPYAGFMGWNQSTDNAVQIDLPCRPCSVYGQKPCFRKDYACLYQITPKQIIQQIENILF